MYSRAQLNKLTSADLRALAEKEFGLEVSEDTQRMDAIRGVLDAQEAKSLVEAGEEAPAPKKEKKFRIIIHNQEGAEGSSFIKIMVNGVMFQINREKEVTVPARVKEVLDNAIQTKFEPDENGDLQPRDVRRFAYTVLGPA